MFQQVQDQHMSRIAASELAFAMCKSQNVATLGHVLYILASLGTNDVVTRAFLASVRESCAVGGQIDV